MNLTVMPQLEDSLVVEITEHERGTCQSSHDDVGNEDCSQTVVAVTTHCVLGDRLMCANYVAFVEREARNGSGCFYCARWVAVCWSVVMLP